MQDLIASRTAILAGMMRGCHARRDPHRVLDDPWIERLVPEPAFHAAHEAARAEKAAGRLKSDAATPRELVDDWLQSSAGYPNVILRSRVAEDALSVAIARGVRQYVLIGAGFDTYALRRTGAGSETQVFEVDHPLTQSLKVRCIERACGALPASTHFVPADLAKESVFQALSRGGFRAGEPAFFSWLGVTMYLPREANLRSLRAIAEHGAPGSEIVFSYLDQVVFREAERDPAGPFATLLKAVASLGEPFRSGFDPATLKQTLAGEGLELVEDIDDVQAAARYDAEGANGFRVRATSRIARAAVPNAGRNRT